MLRKLELISTPTLTKDTRICDSCRIKLSKIGDETDRDSSSTKDPQPTSAGRTLTSEVQVHFVDIETLNGSLLGLGQLPINKRRSEKLQKTLASKAFHVDEVKTEQGIEDAESTIIEKLKDAFRRTNDKNKKIQILTIFDHWSVAQIQKNFYASKSMITLAKRTSAEFGILSTPKGLNKETL